MRRLEINIGNFEEGILRDTLEEINAWAQDVYDNSLDSLGVGYKVFKGELKPQEKRTLELPGQLLSVTGSQQSAKTGIDNPYRSTIGNYGGTSNGILFVSVPKQNGLKIKNTYTYNTMSYSLVALYEKVN